MQVSSNRKSKVNLLPEDIRQALNTFIRSGDMTQKDIRIEINKMIDEAGLPKEAKLSRTGFNRYAKRMEEMGQRLRQSREVAEVWTSKLGDKPTTDISKLLQEFVRTMAFETSMQMMEDAEEKQEIIAPKALNQLALVVQRIEQAAMTSMKREKEIRTQFAAEAAEKADEIIRDAGVSEDTAQAIKDKILGIA